MRLLLVRVPDCGFGGAAATAARGFLFLFFLFTLLAQSGELERVFAAIRRLHAVKRRRLKMTKRTSAGFLCAAILIWLSPLISFECEHTRENSFLRRLSKAINKKSGLHETSKLIGIHARAASPVCQAFFLEAAYFSFKLVSERKLLNDILATRLGTLAWPFSVELICSVKRIEDCLMCD